MEWLPPERARFSSNQRGKSCSQFAHTLAQFGCDVKSVFLCGFHFGGCYNLKMTTDAELLRQVAATRSEAAFAELVQRHVNLVYTAALRQVNGDEHFAKDVAQMVFADLARKAGSLARRETLTGWLYTSAHFAAAKIVRGENRRRDREEKFMREPISETAPDADWEKLRPTLDDAMHELNETDREAILLRYFENRQFVQVGAKLGLNENAARMRVERALEKLRGAFAKRGVTTATALASVISANAIQTAPANLAATLTTASIATAGTGTFTLLKIMTATKLKLAFSALVVAGAATAFVIQHQAQEKLRVENETLKQQLAQLQTENESLSNRLAEIGDGKKLSDDQFNELLKLRGQVGVLQRQVGDLGKLKNENRQLHEQITAVQNSQSSEEQQRQIAIAKLTDARSYALGFIMYANDNHGQFPTNWDEVSSYTNSIPQPNGTNDFEIINQGLLNASELGTSGGSIILIKSPAWLTSNGKWVKAYGFADGHSQIQAQPAEGFDAYEQQHTISPPPNQ
jgi:RNA polymerase sigma factor (sigma-70 family)